ncbi:MAG: hypothetical protein WDW38_007934 [Sanguina aurantia]
MSPTHDGSSSGSSSSSSGSGGPLRSDIAREGSGSSSSGSSSGGAGLDGSVSTLHVTFNSSVLCVQSGTVNTDVKWENPEAVAVTPDGAWLWVIESLAIPCAVNLRGLTVSTTPELARPFSRLTALALDERNALLLLLLRQNALLRYGTPEDSAVHSSRATVTESEIGQVIAGREDEEGCQDGPAKDARFNAPEGIAVDGAGTIIIADTGNFCLRQLQTQTVMIAWHD